VHQPVQVLQQAQAFTLGSNMMQDDAAIAAADALFLTVQSQMV
jgi:hypothetical protein